MMFLMVSIMSTVMTIDCYAFRCGDEIVSRGDSAASVYQKCGRPGYQEAVQANTQGTYKGQGYHYGGGYSEHQGTYQSTTEKTEKWYYNCGANDYIYVLTITGGEVKAVESERRGSGRSECTGR